jgi:plasmid stability protein
LKWNRIRLHNGTVNLTIKNIPEDVCEALKRGAGDRGRSLNAEVIRVLSAAAEEEKRREFIAASHDELRRFKSTLPKLSSSVPLIRADRRRR